MDPNDRPNVGLALEQWEKLVRIYKSFGVKITLIDPVPHLEDMTFTANGGLPFMKDGKPCFIPSRFRVDRRQGEEDHYKNFFRKLGYEVLELPHGVFFEGAGDALSLTDDTLLIGYGFRTSWSAISHIKRITGKTVIPLRLIHPERKDKILYHNDTTMTVFKNERPRIIPYPGAFAISSYIRLMLAIMKRKGVLYEGSYEDAASLALNATVIPIHEIPRASCAPLPASCKGVVVTTDTASDELLKQYEKMGYYPQPTPLSEFVKSGGAAVCLRLVLPC